MTVPVPIANINKAIPDKTAVQPNEKLIINFFLRCL